MTEVVKLLPVNEQHLSVRIVGMSPLIQHKWSEKALKQMREKHAGKKTKTREARNPEQEGEDATYYTEDNKYGIPAMAFKSAMIEAAHKDIGFPKTLLRKSFFLNCSDKHGCIELECSEPELREDSVRVGINSTDLRYRPLFDEWAFRVSIDYDADNLTKGDIINLINRVGFGVGIGEWRPEKGGEFGRFEVDTKSLGGSK